MRSCWWFSSWLTLGPYAPWDVSLANLYSHSFTLPSQPKGSSGESRLGTSLSPKAPDVQHRSAWSSRFSFEVTMETAMTLSLGSGCLKNEYWVGKISVRHQQEAHLAPTTQSLELVHSKQGTQELLKFPPWKIFETKLHPSTCRVPVLEMATLGPAQWPSG